MARMKQVEKEQADEFTKGVFEDIEKKNGKIPNIFKYMGNSPSLLKAYFGLSEALEMTSYTKKEREMLALFVAELNQCSYCLSAHSFIAKSLNLSEDEIESARKGSHDITKLAASFTLIKKIVQEKGHVSDDEVNRAKEQGLTDRMIGELVLIAIANIFTNYFNHLVDPEIDFPIAKHMAAKS